MKPITTILFFALIFCSIEQNLLAAEKNKQRESETIYSAENVFPLDDIYLHSKINLLKVFGTSEKYSAFRDEMKKGLEEASSDKKHICHTKYEKFILDFFKNKAQYLDTNYPGSGPYGISFKDLFKIKPKVDQIEEQLKKIILVDCRKTPEDCAELRRIIRPKIQKFVKERSTNKMPHDMAQQLVKEALIEYSKAEHSQKATTVSVNTRIDLAKRECSLTQSCKDTNKISTKNKQVNCTVENSAGTTQRGVSSNGKEKARSIFVCYGSTGVHQPKNDTSESESDSDSDSDSDSEDEAPVGNFIRLRKAKSMLRIGLRKLFGNIKELKEIHGRIFFMLRKASKDQGTKGFLKIKDCEEIFDREAEDEAYDLDTLYPHGSPLNKIAFTTIFFIESKVQEIEKRVNELVKIPGFPVALQNEIKIKIRPRIQHLVASTQFEAISDEILDQLILQCAYKRKWQPRPRSRQNYINNFAPAIRKYGVNSNKIILQHIKTKDELIKDITADFEEIAQVLYNFPNFDTELLIPLAKLFEIQLEDFLFIPSPEICELIKSKDTETLKKIKDKTTEVKGIINTAPMFQMTKKA